MLDEMAFERRLVTLEQAVSDFQHKVQNKPTPKKWLEKLIGSISDKTSFPEAL